MTSLAFAGQRVALVTGASRGLGAGIARRLGAEGYFVAVNYRSGADPAAEVVDSIRQAGGAADAFSADVTDEEAVSSLVERITGTAGPIAVLVANATGPQPTVAIDDLDWVERHADASPQEIAAYLAEVPMGRMGTIDDIAETVAFLASDRAGFITGQRLTVNGGHTID